MKFKGQAAIMDKKTNRMLELGKVHGCGPSQTRVQKGRFDTVEKPMDDAMPLLSKADGAMHSAAAQNAEDVVKDLVEMRNSCRKSNAATVTPSKAIAPSNTVQETLTQNVRRQNNREDERPRKHAKTLKDANRALKLFTPGWKAI